MEKLYCANKTEKMFGQDTPSLTPLIVFMLGGKIHNENMMRFHFDMKQIQKQKIAINEYIRIVQNTGNTTALAWSANFVRGLLIEVGALQFQPVFADNGTSRVYIHIPGVSLKKEDVLRSVEESRELMRRYYGMDRADYWCDSWLLSPEIHALLNENSNIYKFYSLFDVVPGADCKADIMWNLFHLIDSDTPLPENTSLQRSVKKALEEGQHFFSGNGHWKG